MASSAVVAVVVVGDIGRSPRTCNHALSLAHQMGYEVHLIGYTETTPNSRIQNHPLIRLTPLSPPPASFSERLPEVAALALRFLWTAVMLLWTLIFRVGWRLDFVLCQNPPALPAVAVAWMVCRLRGAKLLIDWHNYSWSMLADRWGVDEAALDVGRHAQQKEEQPSASSHLQPPVQPRSRSHSGGEGRRGAVQPAAEKIAAKKKKRKGLKQRYVELTHSWEGRLGSCADASICVSKAMREDLQSRWGVPAAVFYDRPPSWKFGQTSLEQQHALFLRLAEEAGGEAVWKGEQPSEEEKKGEDIVEYSRFTLLTSSGSLLLRPSRPLLLLSSTSWTPDEDFSILLDAIVKYDEIARVSHNSTAELTLPRILLVITGKGPEKEHYLAKIAKMTLSSVEIQTPWLAADDYPRLLSAAHLGVCLHTSTSGLDLPMKVVDMFGAGLPVLAKRFACIGELVDEGRNGHLFDSAHELSQRIVSLATGHPLHNKSLYSLQDGASGCLPPWEETWDNSVRALFQLDDNGPLQRILATE